VFGQFVGLQLKGMASSEKKKRYLQIMSVLTGNSNCEQVDDISSQPDEGQAQDISVPSSRRQGSGLTKPRAKDTKRVATDMQESSSKKLKKTKKIQAN
jgi:hypothetical protein